MAESVVTFLLHNLTALLQEEVKKFTGIREEALFIIDEFERMRAFLRVADMIEDGDESIRVWVKQVREIAYDTEDVLDEFLLLYFHDEYDGLYRYLSKKARSVKNLRARRRIGSELESIKSRVSNISDGNQINLHKLNIMKQGSTGAASAATNSYSLNDLRRDAQLVEEDQLVGIEKPKNKIIKQLLEGKTKLQVVAVAGMGGLGKTTLVSRVYSDPRVKKHFQHQAFVTVSQLKQDEILVEVIQQLFNEIKQPLPQGADSKDSSKLKRIIADFLREKRYLVVLDDMWNLDSWESLKLAFPNNNHGSRLMITTRNMELTSTSKVDLGGMIHDLKPLSLEESWTLFCAKTFQGNQCPPHLEKSSRNILKRCEGLPLAIVAISGMLATKYQRIDEWEKVDRSVGAEFQGNDKLKSMSKILSLSFNDLPYNLKSCFMYFSMFPEDYLIERSRLIRFWIAEGFVLKQEGRTLEEIGGTYFTELLNRSLIQVGETGNDGKIKTCRVHDLLREIILIKSKEQNFAAIVNEENVNSWPQGVRRLSVHRIMEPLGRHYNLSKLRSLLFFAVDTSPSSYSMSKLFGGGLRLLKVLDCRGAALDKFPKVILKLYNLRYLSLRETQVSFIPSSIRKLKNLETLDLRDTNVVELPVGILEIHGLRHIFVYHLCNRFTASCKTFGFKALSGIERLSCLQSLCFIEANQSFSAGLMESLGKLKQLRRLSILKLKESDGYALCLSIQKMKFLYSLSIESENSKGILNLQNISSPPQCLQRLFMSGRLVKLPSWVSSLSCLVRLYLRWSRLEVDPLIHLQALPNLVQLIFENAYCGQRLCFKAGGFQMLKILMFGKLKRLEEVVVEEEALPHLEELWFRECRMLKEVPSGVKFLTELKYLEFVDMAPELIKRLGRSKIYKDCDKIKHIPSIFTGNQRDWGVDGNYLDA